MITDSQIGDEGVAMVAQLPSLTSLSLDGCMVTGRQGLPEMVGLKSLTLGSCRQLDALVLRQLTSLTHLSLARCVQVSGCSSFAVPLSAGCHHPAAVCFARVALSSIPIPS